jgi:hypothetical protein
MRNWTGKRFIHVHGDTLSLRDSIRSFTRRVFGLEESDLD